jgi:HEAT repeat protein
VALRFPPQSKTLTRWPRFWSSNVKAVFKLHFGHCQHQILCVNPVNRRRQFGLFVSLGLVITAAAFIALRPREPEYQGKRLGEWLRDFDRGPGTPAFANAEEAVRAMGTNCLPMLMSELRAQESPLVEKLLRLTAKQRWVRVSYTQHWTRWERAVSGFWALGQRAEPAIPALFHMLDPGDNDRMRSRNWAVGRALNAIGPAAARAVSQLLADQNTLVRYWALDILADFRADDAKEAIPKIMLCIKTGRELSFRNQAALCLESMAHGDPDMLVPIYIARLEDPNRYPRLNAAGSLGKLGARATASVPALLSALNDPSERVRIEAGSALKLVDPEAAAKASVK